MKKYLHVKIYPNLWNLNVKKLTNLFYLTRSARVKHLKFMFYEFINTVNLFPTLSLSLSVNGLIKPTSPIMLRQYVEDHLQINNLSGVKLNIIFAKF